MTILRHTVKTMAIQTVGQDGGNHAAVIPLAGPDGWVLEIDGDRTATAPRGGPILAARAWNADPVVRHADKRKDRG